MTRIVGVRFLGVLMGVTCLPFANAVAYAQGPCTAPPPTPANAAASETTPGNSSRPALVTVTWVGVPTTGPNAVSGYIIEVGNAPGVTNIAQFNTGSTAVSTVQPANNGTYYVRVRAANGCGLSAPSPEPVVTVAGTIAAGEPAAWVTAAVYGGDSAGDVFVAGEIRGSWGASAAASVRIDAAFLAADGRPIGTDFTYALGRSRRVISTRIIDDTTLGAGESGCFQMITSTPIRGVARVILNTTWSSSQLETLRGNVVVQNVVQDTDSSGYLVLRGQPRNAGAVTTYFNQVNIDVRDTQNRVGLCDFEFVVGSNLLLPSGQTTNTALAPGQVGSFVSYTFAPRREVGRVSTWPGWEEADTGPATPTANPLSWHRLVEDVDAVPALAREGRARLRNAAIQKLRELTEGK